MEVEKDIIDIKKVGDSWVREEFAGIEFGDKRLNKRFIKLAGLLSAKHEEPINQACEDWANTKAAYRFFANGKSEAKKIMESHQKSTARRMRNFQHVLSIHDTTYLNYTDHESKEGLGKIGKSNQKELQGLVVHGTLITTLEGLPLGRLTQKIWARDFEGNKNGRNYQRQKIEEKESYKWIEQLREAMLHCPAGVEAIHVCDRESDIYEFFVEAEKLGTYMLIRANQNRQLLDEDEEKLWEYMANYPISKKIEIEVPAKNKQPARIAHVQLKFAPVEIKRPRRRVVGILQKEALQKSIFLTAIWLYEAYPPKGIEGLQWMLLTNLPVEDFEDTLTCIKWYKMRWQIESYHKIWKSGCKIEDCRLEKVDRLIRYITLMSIIAWRIFWMTHLNRKTPMLPCSMILAEHEWKSFYCKIHKTNIPPAEVPTIYQAIRWIAQLGGFLARKNDGEPGSITIWRGWQRLTDIAETWLIINNPATCG